MSEDNTQGNSGDNNAQPSGAWNAGSSDQPVDFTKPSDPSAPSGYESAVGGYEPPAYGQDPYQQQSYQQPGYDQQQYQQPGYDQQQYQQPGYDQQQYQQQGYQQPYAPQPYGQVYPAGGYPVYPVAASSNGMAIASLVCGLCGILCVLSSLAGIGLGIAGLNQAKRTGIGRGMAIAGISISAAWIVLVAAFWILIVSLSN